MTATRITHRMNSPRPKVYRALVDGGAVAKWMAPTGMTSHVHAFDPWRSSRRWSRLGRR